MRYPNLTLLALVFSAVGSDASVQYTATRHVSLRSSGQALTPLPYAPFAAPIVSRSARRPSKAHALHSLRAAGSASTTPLVGANYDFEYLANITIGGQNFAVIVDTGSSDTWLAKKGFSCFNLTGHPEPVSTCAFGSHGFDTVKSKSYMCYPNTTFAISYGDGEYLSGTAAFETVTIGNLTVTHQEIGIVSSAAWVGDNINSGLLGLAYPSLTSVHGSSSGESMPYSPFFFTAVKQGKVPHPYFSLALNRGTPAGQHSEHTDPNLGYLAFGGIAPVSVTSTSVTVPIQGYSMATRTPTSGSNSTFFYYTVDVQKYVFPGSTTVHTASNSTIVDSGTTLNLVPSHVARAYNAGFGTLRDGSYYVDCKAQAPPFTVVLGGKSFTIDGRDQIVPVGKDAKGQDLCVSGTQDGGAEMDGSLFVLGDVFMKNVVTTFDIRRNTITFTQRKWY
ncbi:acid protease [Mycena rebaudengoi]|nr:acid protease [Mycena rebaudengoi]